MKGFLNKVQRRVSGAGSETADEKPSSAAPQPALSSNGIEVTPKADVILPKKERR
jgi:hypothetical protein